MNATKAVAAAMILSLAAIAVGQSPSDRSVEWVCQKYPERIAHLFDNLAPDAPGLEKAQAARNAGNMVEASKALLDYYRAVAPKRGGQKPPKPGTRKSKGAEQILGDVITNQNVPGKQPRRADGGWDWTYNGPQNDREWGWFVNRMGHISSLYRAYRSTGNPAYARNLDERLRDWIVSSPYSGKKSNTPQWRGLEVSIRIPVWILVFYGMMDDPLMADSTRLLMLSSIPDHAHYLRYHHAAGGNWIANEMDGLSKLAMAWPEFAKSEGWIAYAVKNMTAQIDEQVYPDGAQKELTSHYHQVTVHHFESFCDRLQKNGREPSAHMLEYVEAMWNYLAYTVRPDGHGLLNNDANLDNNRRQITAHAKKFDRPDWLYIATNGKQGKEPDAPPSRMFPWAGHLVMRNGWDADAHWAFFDVGPYGIGHQHRDKLHLSVAAFGRDLLVDAGRYYYRRDAWRTFFVGSPSHNVVLVDGKQQKAYDKVTNKPLPEGVWRIAPEFDYARGTFDAGYEGLAGKASHTRAVLYVRDRFWIVVDRVASDRPRTLQTLWHFHPHCTVALEGPAAASTDSGKGNLRVTPSESITWKPTIVKGQEKPTIQGWYSREYNQKAASPAVVYETQAKGPVTFAWLLTAAKGPAPEGAIRIERADDKSVDVVVETGGKTVRATVPLGDGVKPAVAE